MAAGKNSRRQNDEEEDHNNNNNWRVKFITKNRSKESPIGICPHSNWNIISICFLSSESTLAVSIYCNFRFCERDSKATHTYTENNWKHIVVDGIKWATRTINLTVSSSSSDLFISTGRGGATTTTETGNHKGSSYMFLYKYSEIAQWSLWISLRTRSERENGKATATIIILGPHPEENPLGGGVWGEAIRRDDDDDNGECAKRRMDWWWEEQNKLENELVCKQPPI